MAGNTSNNSEISDAPLSEQIRSFGFIYWICNWMELVERFAYYGVRVVLPVFMVAAFEEGGPQLDHSVKGAIYGVWAVVQSYVPIVSGVFADRYGYKINIALATIFKIIGYLLMGYCIVLAETIAGIPVEEARAAGSDWTLEFLYAGCMFLAFGTALFKPGVQGLLANQIPKGASSLGWGLFYQMVNIGGFIGPLLAGYLRILDWNYVFLACSFGIALNFIPLFFFDEPEREGTDTTEGPLRLTYRALRGLLEPRLFFFTLAFAGFWLMFFQLFDILPNFIDDWIDSREIAQFLIHFSFLHLFMYVVVGAIAYQGLQRALTHGTAPSTSRQGIAQLFLGIFVFALILDWDWYQTLFPSLGLSVAALAFTFFILELRRNRAAGSKTPPLLASSAFVIILFTYLDWNLILGPGGVPTINEGNLTQEWILNLNALLISIFAFSVAFLTGKIKSLHAIILGIAISAVGIYALGLSMSGWWILIAIAIFSLGEMAASPTKMRYLASIAPKGQEGQYMGYANFTVGIGWSIGSIVAGNMYQEGGDKVVLAKRYLIEEQGVAKETLEAMKKTEIMPFLQDTMGVDAWQARQLLWDLYEPFSMWYIFTLIGLASMLIIVLYNWQISQADKNPEHSFNTARGLFWVRLTLVPCILALCYALWSAYALALLLNLVLASIALILSFLKEEKVEELTRRWRRWRDN